MSYPTDYRFTAADLRRMDKEDAAADAAFEARMAAEAAEALFSTAAEAALPAITLETQLEAARRIPAERFEAAAAEYHETVRSARIDSHRRHIFGRAERRPERRDAIASAAIHAAADRAAAEALWFREHPRLSPSLAAWVEADEERTRAALWLSAAMLETGRAAADARAALDSIRAPKAPRADAPYSFPFYADMPTANAARGGAFEVVIENARKAPPHKGGCARMRPEYSGRRSAEACNSEFQRRLHEAADARAAEAWAERMRRQIERDHEAALYEDAERTAAALAATWRAEDLADAADPEADAAAAAEDRRALADAMADAAAE